MFEKASRMKLRFDCVAGIISVEDLWVLPLTSRTGRANLDDIAKSLNASLKEANEESFVVQTSKPNELLALSFEIVKHVISARLAENEVKRNATDLKERKQKLLGLLADKDDAELQGKSREEIQKMVDAL